MKSRPGTNVYVPLESFMKKTIKIGDFLAEYSPLIENKCLTMYNRNMN